MAQAEPDNASPALSAKRSDGGVLELAFEGSLDAHHLHGVWSRALAQVRSAKAPTVRADASGVSYCDSSGATMLRDLESAQRAHGGTFELHGFPQEFAPVLSLLRGASDESEPAPRCVSWPETIGRATMSIVQDLGFLVASIGEITAGLAHAVWRPRSVKWRFVASAAQTAGVNSLPIVLLVAGLLGMILGFQSSPILHNYGADLLLANLIGISFLRELGPLMTAVVLTARSGSAFAAEIGTMKISEEVDALRTMGVNPIRFLVVPRVIAAIVMTPLLTVFANLAGISGGYLVWSLSLDLSFPGYVAQLEAALRAQDFYTGLTKSVVFGTLIAGIGCVRGMNTEGSPSAVGQSTTSAVVSGIVMIALSDAAFTMIFHVLEL